MLKGRASKDTLSNRLLLLWLFYEELATIDVYLDDENFRSIMEASESAKKKPLLSMDEVF